MNSLPGNKKVDASWSLRQGPFLAFTIVAVIIASIFITLGWVSGSGDSSFSTPPATPGTPPSPTVAFSGKSKGSPDAPVTIIDYSDFQCSHCQEFALTIERQLQTDYIDTGKVLLIYKHLIVFDEESVLAAEASEAAAEQDKFWPYYALLMQVKASPDVKDDLSIAKLQSLAQQVGLDMETFNASLQSRKYREKVMQENTEGRALGVTGAPTFFINGVKKVGRGSFDDFKTIIDDLLQESGTTLPPTPGTPPSPPVPISGKSKGSPNAPVTIIDYSDFQCSHCQEFALTIEKQLQTAYIDTGKVLFIYKHIIAYGEESQLAAEASEAAAEQGKFWPYYDLLMQARASTKTDDLPISKLQSLAQQVGLDMETFNASLQSHKYREKVLQEDAEGRALGVTAVPTFFINGIKKDGASSFEELQVIIDDILEKSSK